MVHKVLFFPLKPIFHFTQRRWNQSKWSLHLARSHLVLFTEISIGFFFSLLVRRLKHKTRSTSALFNEEDKTSKSLQTGFQRRKKKTTQHEKWERPKQKREGKTLSEKCHCITCTKRITCWKSVINQNPKQCTRMHWSVRWSPHFLSLDLAVFRKKKEQIYWSIYLCVFLSECTWFKFFFLLHWECVRLMSCCIKKVNFDTLKFLLEAH